MTVHDGSFRTSPPIRPHWVGRRHVRWCVWAVILVVSLVGLGCKSKDASSNGTRSNDPLVVGPGRIPKQSLPIPERGTAGNKGRDDPLLSAPVGRPGETSGSGYSDDPDRQKVGLFLPGRSTTPAALAARVKDDGDSLRLEIPGGVTLTPAGGSGLAGAGSAGVPAELVPYRIKASDYTVVRENGQYVVEVKVPIEEAGARRGYKGAGPTEAAAVQQIVDQLQAERK